MQLEPDKGFVPLWLFMILVVMTFESIIFFLIRGLGPLGLMLLTYAWRAALRCECLLSP